MFSSFPMFFSRFHRDFPTCFSRQVLPLHDLLDMADLAAAVGGQSGGHSADFGMFSRVFPGFFVRNFQGFSLGFSHGLVMREGLFPWIFPRVFCDVLMENMGFRWDLWSLTGIEMDFHMG